MNHNEREHEDCNIANEFLDDAQESQDQLSMPRADAAEHEQDVHESTLLRRFLYHERRHEEFKNFPDNQQVENGSSDKDAEIQSE